MKREVKLYEDRDRNILGPDGNIVSTGGGYGIVWDQDADTYKRIGGSNYTLIQSKMRRCTVLDGGSVNYYLDANDSTKKADGTDAVLDGTDGQVMVEIPAFYYKYAFTERKNHIHRISEVKLDGFELHPAFIVAGKEVGKRYIGAYEADLVDDKLTSISGTYPYCGQTIGTFRTKAMNRGAGWHLQDYNLTFAIQVLAMTEFGTMNLQDALGMGRTGLSGGTWEDGSYYGQSGLSNVVGNGTGNAEYVGDADDAGADAAYMSYRGIENLYGNVWNIVDGVKFNDHVPYISNDPDDWTDELTSSYVSTGITQSTSNGYGRKLAQTSTGMFISSISGGSVSTGTTDYYYQQVGLRILLFGAYAADGLKAGAWCLACSWAASDSTAYVSSRTAR